jgi:hypothetical protein
MVRSKLIDVYNTYVFSWTPSIGATNNQDALPPRLNCAAATVHTGKDFYGPFGMGYSEFVAQDVQGYDIMQHFESCLRKKGVANLKRPCIFWIHQGPTEDTFFTKQGLKFLKNV